MNKHALHFMPFILLVLFLVSITGCGQQKDQPQKSSSAQTTAAPSQPVSQPATPKGDASRGKTLYNQYCVACHGPEGRGLPKLGKPLRTSSFAKGLSDKELVAFIKRGRDVTDPLNTTGVAMPPKGGNPAITDEQLYDIVAYLRSIAE